MFESRSFINSTKDGLYDQLCDSLDCRFGLSADFSGYQNDPVGFGEDILKESYTDDVKRMMESVRDNPVTVAKSANATGKTHGAARVAVWFYKAFPDCQVYTAAAPPESNLKKLLWGELGSLVENHPDLFKSDTVKSLHIERSAKSFTTGVTIPMSGTAAQRQAKFSGKHAPHLLFILDEGDAIPDEVFTAIESCLSGGHGRLLVMFNPRAESGEAYRMERDSRANVVGLSAFNHPNVISGEDRVPGAVTRGVTVRRINEWCRPLVRGERPDSECFELPAFLEGAVSASQAGTGYPPLKPGWFKIMEPAFSYMVLGEYPAQGTNALISREWIARARSRWDVYVAENGEQPPRGTMAVMGQDVAEFGSDINVSCFRYGGYVERLVFWSGIDTMATSDRAIAEYQGRRVTLANVDATGIGVGVAPYMQRHRCSANPVKVASSPTKTTEMGEFYILRDQLWWQVREWLRTDPGAMLPPDEMLLEELQIPTYEVVNGKIRTMKKDVMKDLLKRSPDRADALCLTFAEGDLLFPNL
ncbi:MAG: hypothetical protein HGJ94_06785 [Desulfosarcina sp.]|nr:hypothetical protein [Desulfosarcina sp.]MBC2744153.1 hypothetical protein [Desulfosarcina sp.]MBC2767062.1 hypothetical protein [Desulfosarcina sp.]